jgi:hypothetical protein
LLLSGQAPGGAESGSGVNDPEKFILRMEAYAKPFHKDVGSSWCAEILAGAEISAYSFSTCPSIGGLISTKPFWDI